MSERLTDLGQAGQTQEHADFVEGDYDYYSHLPRPGGDPVYREMGKRLLP